MKRQILEAIKIAAGTFQQDIVTLIVCNVDSVDATELTCDCTPISSENVAPLPSVALQAEPNDGVIITPKIDSTVVVAITKKNTAFVILFSEISSVETIIFNGTQKTVFKISQGLAQFNDGSFDGLVKINDLKTQYDNNIAAIKAAVGAGFAAVDVALNALVTGSGVSSAAFNSSAAAILNLNKITLENTLVKHGV